MLRHLPIGEKLHSDDHALNRPLGARLGGRTLRCSSMRQRNDFRAEIGQISVALPENEGRARGPSFSNQLACNFLLKEGQLPLAVYHCRALQKADHFGKQRPAEVVVAQELAVYVHQHALGLERQR